ncbi:BrxA/BrxB family bacilliredoxin [Streptomyces sp. NPDC054995]
MPATSGRPTIRDALATVAKGPDRLLSVFTGQDTYADEHLRKKHFADMPLPSEACCVLFIKDGEFSGIIPSSKLNVLWTHEERVARIVGEINEQLI